jgi:hypothetical protein
VALERALGRRIRTFVKEGSWKDVPLPPRLAGLGTDRRGFLAAFVAPWTKEEARLVRHEPAPPGYAAPTLPDGRIRVQYLGAFDDSLRGRGTPVLGQVSPQRQRRCMVERRCGVCGRRFGPREHLWFIGSLAMLRDGVIEPPVHRGCARYALQVCPQLQFPGVMVYPTATYELVPGRVGQDGGELDPSDRSEVGLLRWWLARPLPAGARFDELQRELLTREAFLRPQARRPQARRPRAGRSPARRSTAGANLDRA